MIKSHLHPRCRQHRHLLLEVPPLRLGPTTGGFHHGSDVEIDWIQAEDVEGLLAEGRLRDLDGIVLGSVPFGVVLPQAHPLADRAEIPVAGLGRETVVMFPWSPFSGIWQRIVDHLLPRGAQPGQVVVEPDLINSPEAILRAMWITNADLCRLDGRIGLIAPGAFGDLVVSRVDPLADIIAFADVDASLSHVIQTGRVLVER